MFQLLFELFEPHTLFARFLRAILRLDSLSLRITRLLSTHASQRRGLLHALRHALEPILRQPKLLLLPVHRGYFAAVARVLADQILRAFALQPLDDSLVPLSHSTRPRPRLLWSWIGSPSPSARFPRFDSTSDSDPSAHFQPVYRALQVELLRYQPVFLVSVVQRLTSRVVFERCFLSMQTLNLRGVRRPLKIRAALRPQLLESRSDIYSLQPTSDSTFLQNLRYLRYFHVFLFHRFLGLSLLHLIQPSTTRFFNHTKNLLWFHIQDLRNVSLNFNGFVVQYLHDQKVGVIHIQLNTVK